VGGRGVTVTIEVTGPSWQGMAVVPWVGSDGAGGRSGDDGAVHRGGYGGDGRSVAGQAASMAIGAGDPGLPGGQAVTGHVGGGRHLGVLPAVRAHVASLSLARVGRGRYLEVEVPLRGVLGVFGSTSDEVAARWNELIRR